MAIVRRFFMAGLPALHSMDGSRPGRAAVNGARGTTECN